jgi:hypothetical protein
MGPCAKAEKPKRRAISQKTRFEVFKRDGFVCQYCGAHPPKVVLQVDHIVAVARGGRNAMDNYVTSCQPCNIGKGANDLRVVPQSLADKAADVAEREAQLAGYSKVMEAARSRRDADAWRAIRAVLGPVDEVRQDEFNSAVRFVEKLGLHEVLDAAEIARGASARTANLFRYFCGICWNKIRAGGEL